MEGKRMIEKKKKIPKLETFGTYTSCLFLVAYRSRLTFLGFVVSPSFSVFILSLFYFLLPKTLFFFFLPPHFTSPSLTLSQALPRT